MDKTLDLDHKPVSGFSDGNEILRDKLPHVRATAQSEEKTGWELMHRLNSGFRLFHLTVFLALPPAGQHHRDGMGILDLDDLLEPYRSGPEPRL